MTDDPSVQAAVKSGLVSVRMAQEIERMMAETGEPASYVCGLTGGERPKESQLALVAFLKERERLTKPTR